MDRNAYSAVHCPPDFQGGGLVNKYVRQEFIALSQEEKDYTKRQTKYPWRYSFSTIVENPTEHVYAMLDIFRNHKYYLYSPAVTKFLKEYPARTFFYLIEFVDFPELRLRNFTKFSSN